MQSNANAALAENIALGFYTLRVGGYKLSTVPSSEKLYCNILTSLVYEHRSKVFAWVAGTGLFLLASHWIYNDVSNVMREKRPPKITQERKRPVMKNVSTQCEEDLKPGIQQEAEKEEKSSRFTVQFIDHPMVEELHIEKNIPESHAVHDLSEPGGGSTGELDEFVDVEDKYEDEC